MVSYRASGMWKSILTLISDFQKWFCYRVHNGHLISLWDDVWCGNMMLGGNLEHSFLKDSRPHSVVGEKFEVLGG